MKKYLRVTAPPLLIGTILIASLMVAFAGSVAPVAAQEIPRNETVQMGGYEGPPNALRPWDIAGQAGMAFFFMYEPLFGVNIAVGSEPEDLLKIVGESIEWLNPTTIEVKIRDEAEWTDGKPITSADVEYSYGVYGLASDTKTWVAQEVAPLKERLESWENVDDKTFRVNIKSEYPNSAVVWRHMTLSYNILPKHVWEEIEAEYGADMRTFANDWQAADMPDEWKVASGMYLPDWHDDDRTIMKRNENWWGKDIFGLPAPKYILHINYHYSNAPAALDFQNNELDVCGKFIPGIGDIMGAMPQTHTYDPNPPYYAEKSIKLLVPNHRKYPLNEPWLHKAIAMALDYSAISAVSSGYLKAPYPYTAWHLLPADDAVAKALVNPELETQYAIYNDLDGALDILEEHCIKVDGTWYTKGEGYDEWLALYGEDAMVPEDALPGEPGMNVPLGPWSIMDQQGWSDVLAIDALACSMIKSIGITMTQKVVDWGTNDADGHAFNYDFMHFVMHSSTGTMYDRYYQMFVGTDYYWNHYGDYRNPDLVELIRQLDITAGAEQQAVADQILTILGEDMPLIPFGGHPDWYQYNDLYWLGFPNKDTNQILPAGPFGGTANSAILQTIVLGLEPNPEAPTPPAAAAIPMEYVYATVAIIAIVIVVAVGYILMKRGKK